MAEFLIALDRGPARELPRQGRQLRFLQSIPVHADETVFCLFEADVWTVSEQAGVPFERVLESIRIDGSQSD